MLAVLHPYHTCRTRSPFLFPEQGWNTSVICPFTLGIIYRPPDTGYMLELFFLAQTPIDQHSHIGFWECILESGFHKGLGGRKKYRLAPALLVEIGTGLDRLGNVFGSLAP